MSISYKQGDTHNVITSELIKNNEPINLEGCSVYISVTNKVYEDRCIILDHAKGLVSYPISNISKTNGFFYYEYKIIYPDGTSERVPGFKNKKIRIIKNIERVVT